MIPNFVIAQGKNFQVGNEFSIGEIFSSRRGQVIVIEEKLFKIGHVVGFAKVLDSLVSNVIS